MREPKPPVMLRCFCCAQSYERGRYRCCAPPNNMSGAAWLAQHCKACSNDPTGLRTVCPRHCTCKKPAGGSVDFGTFVETVKALAQDVPALRLVKSDAGDVTDVGRARGFSRAGR